MINIRAWGAKSMQNLDSQSQRHMAALIVSASDLGSRWIEVVSSSTQPPSALQDGQLVLRLTRIKLMVISCPCSLLCKRNDDRLHSSMWMENISS